MAFDPGPTIEDVVSNVLGFAVGAPGGQGAIDRTVTPAVVGQPGSAPWLVLSAQGSEQTTGWTPGRTEGKLTFWRKLSETQTEYVEVQLAGTPSINSLDSGAGGSGNLVLTRDAWQAFFRDVPNLMGDGKRLDPQSIQQTRLWFAAVANYYGVKHDELTAMLANLDQDADSFRGSASETFTQRVGISMDKVAGARERAQQWDAAFDNAYQQARIFRENLLRELTALGARYEGALLNPINFVIKLLNNARVESTLAGQGAAGNVAATGLFGGGDPGETVPSHTVLLTVPDLGAAAGPYDVFSPASWTALDAAVRAKWAADVVAVFPDTVTSAPQLTAGLTSAASALRGEAIPGERPTDAPPTGPQANILNGPNDLNAQTDEVLRTGEGGPDTGPGPGAGDTPPGVGDQIMLSSETGGGNGELAFTGDPSLNGQGDNSALAGEGNGEANQFVQANSAFETGSADGLGGGDGFGADADPSALSANSTVNADVEGAGNLDATGAGAGGESVMGSGGAVAPMMLMTGMNGGVGGTNTSEQDQDLVGGGVLGLAGGSGTSLGQASQADLARLRDSGALDSITVTDEMRDALWEAGMPGDTAVVLSELTLDQLSELQDRGLLDGLSVTGSDNLMIADDNWAVGGGLDDASLSQLVALRDDGTLDSIQLSEQMRDALTDAGLPVSDGSTLGDLSEGQLGALQDAGLLTDLPPTPAAEGAGLFAVSQTDVGSALDLGGATPDGLGDLSSGQLSRLQGAGLLDDIPITPEQITQLQTDALLGADLAGLDSLGDLSPAQLQDLQLGGLLDGLDLTPGQLTELGLGAPASGPGLTPDQLGGTLPSSQFPTAVNALDLGLDEGTGGLGGDLPIGGGGAPLGNVSQTGATSLGNGTGVSVKAFAPTGQLAGLENIGTLNLSSAVAGSGAGAGTTPALGSPGSPMPMMPMGGAMGGGMAPGVSVRSGRGRDRTRHKDLEVFADDVWGVDPECAPAVVGRFDHAQVEAEDTPLIEDAPDELLPLGRRDPLRRSETGR